MRTHTNTFSAHKRNKIELLQEQKGKIKNNLQRKFANSSGLLCSTTWFFIANIKWAMGHKYFKMKWICLLQFNLQRKQRKKKNTLHKNYNINVWHRNDGLVLLAIACGCHCKKKWFSRRQYKIIKIILKRTVCINKDNMWVSVWCKWLTIEY